MDENTGKPKQEQETNKNIYRAYFKFNGRYLFKRLYDETTVKEIADWFYEYNPEANKLDVTVIEI